MNFCGVRSSQRDRSRFRFSFHTLPITSIDTLGFAPGQHVRKGSIFATDKSERPVFVATTDFILKDSWIENDRFCFEKVEIFAPLKQEPEKAHIFAKFLIGEYERGNLNIERCSQDPKFKILLMHLIDRLLKCLREQPRMSQSLNGIPTLLTPDEVKLILRTIDWEAIMAAHSVSQRFESTAMRERFKAEHNAWWDATPLGPLTQSFAHSEMNASMGEYVTPFSTLSYALSVFHAPVIDPKDGCLHSRQCPQQPVSRTFKRSSKQCRRMIYSPRGISLMAATMS